MEETITIHIDCEIEKQWTQVPNAIINDENMSPKAKLMFIYIKSRPNDWKLRVAHVQKVLQMGRDAVWKYMNELEDKGYIVRHQKHIDGRYRENHITLFWPAKQSPEIQITENAGTEIQCTGNQGTYQRLKVVKTEEKNTDLKDLKIKEKGEAAATGTRAYRIGWSHESKNFDGEIVDATVDWIDAYPNVKVVSAIGRCRGWCADNWKGDHIDLWDFIDNWLSKDATGHDKGGYRKRAGKRSATTTPREMINTNDIKAFANGEEERR